MPAAPAIIGRDAELSEVMAFVRGAAAAPAPTAPAGLILEGEPGIGKTALWTAGVTRARELGVVLACRAARPEMRLSLAGLCDLLGPVADDVLPSLPAPMGRALEVALLRADAGETPLEQRALMAAFAAAVKSLSSQGGVLIAIDDVQWLDAATAEVLGFALRRRSGEPVRVLASLRSPAPEEPPLDLAGALAPHQVRRLLVGPLPVGAVGGILRSQVAAGLSWPTVRRIHSASHGNPFYALELARSLPPATDSVDEPLRVPPSLRQLVHDRLASFPEETSDTLLLTAAAPVPLLSRLAAAAGGGSPERALRPAITAKVVMVEDDLVRFAHPLWAAAAYSSASTSRRRSAHRRLARTARDAEERARHLALAADGPREDVAAALTTAARQARARGAAWPAAELAGLASRLSPAGEARLRRSIEAAEYLFQAGDAGRARKSLETLVEAAPAGPLRARAMLALGRVRMYELDVEPLLRILAGALRDAAGDPVLQAEIHVMMAWLCESDLPAGLEHARTATALLPDTSEPSLLASALDCELTFEHLCGGRIPAGLADRALALERRSAPARVADRPSFRIGTLLRCEGDLDGARTRLLASVAAVTAEQDEASRFEVLASLVRTELLAGDWAAAQRYATDAAASAELAGHSDVSPITAMLEAEIDALCGRVAEAKGKASQALRRASAAGSPFAMLRALSVLGFAALSAGEAAEAVRYLSQADKLCERIGLREPGRYPFHGDYAEALIAAGDLDQAEDVIGRLEARGRELGRRWVQAVAARCRALLCGARGDANGAAAAIAAALDYHRGLPMPFELGRTHLVAGEISRRFKHRKQAAGELGQALELFDLLGAPLWSRRASAELARVGLRTASPTGLTQTEHQVASLVCAGLSNREVAERMFISMRTVESNLTRIYRKLGVRSRTELALAYPASERAAGNRS